MKFEDAEILSAYLDGQLAAEAARRVESRLADSRELQELLRDIRLSRHILRKAPRRAAPRNFTLTPTSRRVRGPLPRTVPMLRYASALAALLFVSALGVNSLAPLSRSLAAAPAPAYGMGGGGGGAGGAAEPMVTAEAPLQEAPAGALAAATPPVADAMRPAIAPTAGPAEVPESAQALATKSAETRSVPIPWGWEFGLGVAAILFAWLAWYGGRISARNIRSRYLEK
jgi:anti-sigma factor RsiW